MAKILEIRNSTAEFLSFLAENKEDGVQVVYKEEHLGNSNCYGRVVWGYHPRQ